MESNRQKLSRERKPKARSIIRAAHAILQTYDPATVIKLCREIINNANGLLAFITLLQNMDYKGHCDLCHNSNVPDHVCGVCHCEENFPLREGMEGL